MQKRNESQSTLVRCFIVVAYWLFINLFPPALSLNGESVEYPVKLAFLYSFTKFVEWPADSYSHPGAPLAICVVGHDPFSPDIEVALQTRKVGSHPVKVLSRKPAEALGVCHMVFIPVTEKDQASRIVRSL